MQRLKASLTAKDKEMNALRMAQSAKVVQLCLAHEMEREKWLAKNSKVKEEQAQTQPALQNDRNINSGHLKSIFELLSKDPLSSFSFVPPSYSSPT